MGANTSPAREKSAIRKCLGWAIYKMSVAHRAVYCVAATCLMLGEHRKSLGRTQVDEGDPTRTSRTHICPRSPRQNSGSLLKVVVLQFFLHRRYDAMDSFYVLGRKAVGKSVHPRCL